MASIVTLALDNGALVATCVDHECGYCHSAILSGQRWVREKIYEPFTAGGPRYRRYHSDLFGEEELSCWEKHQIEQDVRRTIDHAA
jgi:hypothetical protein